MTAPLQNGAQPTSRTLQTLRTKLRPFGTKPEASR